MKLTYLVLSALFLLSINNGLSAQTINTVHMCDLSSEISETSGLIWIDGELWTHNDSGGESALYQIDTASGAVLRTVQITNSTNHDWEDICTDDNYVYIGDIGNNNGNRTDLKIYRISKDFIYLDFDEITADTISFNYPNQTQFEWDNYTTNFDCEAMIATADSLYLFSKNWGNHKTYLYALPKTPGTHAAHIKDSLDVNGLITGAAYNENNGQVLLIGYAPFLSSCFVHQLNNYSGDDFFGGSNLQINLSLVLHQVEGIEFLRETEFIFSNESFNSVDAGLKRGNLNDLANIINDASGKTEPCIFPNPANKTVRIDNCNLYKKLRIYDINGQLVLEKKIDSANIEINVQCFKSGTYSLEFSSLQRIYRNLMVIQ